MPMRQKMLRNENLSSATCLFNFVRFKDASCQRVSHLWFLKKKFEKNKILFFSVLQKTNIVSKKTLSSPKLIENTWSVTSRLCRLVLHKKCVQSGSSKSNIDPHDQKLWRFLDSNFICVSCSIVAVNHPWRIKNYSTRYLLYESCFANAHLFLNCLDMFTHQRLEKRWQEAFFNTSEAEQA